MYYLKIVLKIEKVIFLFNNTDAVENCGILSFHQLKTGERCSLIFVLVISAQTQKSTFYNDFRV